MVSLLLTGVSSAEKVSVTIAEDALINGRDIYLGDIAAIESASESVQAFEKSLSKRVQGGEAPLLDKIRKILICPAAEPGSSVTLHSSFIKSRVRQQGVSPESILWGGSQQTTIQTRCTRMSPEELISSAEKFLKAMVDSNPKPGSRFNLQPVSEIKPAILPYGEVNIKVETVSPSSSSGVIPLRFIISVNGRDCEKRVIPFKVEVIREVVVAARSVDAHKILDADDLCIASRDTGIDSGVFFEKSDLIGKRAKRAMPKDAIVFRGMVEDPPIIKQGDVVTILIESPVFRITAQGKAKEDGIRGQIIKVVNTSSMKEITAQVVSEKLVQVAF